MNDENAKNVIVKEGEVEEEKKRRRGRKKIQRNKSDRVQKTDAFWRSARVTVSELSFKWHSFMFPMLFCLNSAHFLQIQLVCEGRTDGHALLLRCENASKKRRRGKIIKKQRTETEIFLPLLRPSQRTSL